MRLVAYLLIGLFVAVSPTHAGTPKGDIPAEYGRRMLYLDGPLKYPDFTVRFVGLAEHHVAGTRLSSTSYTFEVFDDKNRKHDDFAFTMSGVYKNTSEFMVDGKKYVAEMFDSTGRALTAGTRSAMGEIKLSDKEVIVWDEATAKRGNPDLRKFWRKGFEPGIR